MPRHTDPRSRRPAPLRRLPSLRRPAPLRRAATTAGLTAAALVVGVGGYTVATSPVLADAPGDRFALADLFDGAEVTAQPLVDPQARRTDDQASRSVRGPLQAGLPSTSAQAQAWVDEVDQAQAAIDARTAAEEAARAAAAQAEATRLAAEADAARAAAEVEAVRVAAAEEAARVAAAEEAARVAAAEEAAQVAAAEREAVEDAAREAEEAEREAAEEAEREAAEEAEREAAQEQEQEQEEQEEQESEAASYASADPGSNRAIAQDMLADRGFGSAQWSCLDDLWQKESGWDHTADNPSSSAYGIPQSLPGSKMASAGSDWETNPATQISWGLGYIENRYGSPCAAWEHSVSNNWY